MEDSAAIGGDADTTTEDAEPNEAAHRQEADVSKLSNISTGTFLTQHVFFLAYRRGSDDPDGKRYAGLQITSGRLRQSRA